jgi:Fe-S cluster assembly protein SufD
VSTQLETKVNPRFVTQAEASVAASATSGLPALLVDLRRTGAEQFAALGFPTRRDEDWHYTSVAPIEEGHYVSAVDGQPTQSDVSLEQLAPFRLGGKNWPTLVFVNGRLAPALSSLDALPEGIRVLDLGRAAVDEPEMLQRHLAVAAPSHRDGLTALNAAYIGEGTLIHVAQEMVSDVPVHVLHVMDRHGAATMAHYRHVIVAERHAKASVIESFIALDDVQYFTNSVTEVYVEAGATLSLTAVQREARSAHHVRTVEARQDRDSHFMSFAFQTGAALSRTNVYTVLGGEGCGTTINGLCMLDGQQHGDHQTRVEHVAPNCFSREMYKMLLDNTSHGVFNGKVYVHPEAQKTDGKQTNNTLLLSDRAQIDTKPQLEIFADDVKCTHGATVGRIDEMARFYLLSRGIGTQLSRRLLTYAFAADVLETIDNEPVKQALEDMTLQRFTGDLHA